MTSLIEIYRRFPTKEAAVALIIPVGVRVAAGVSVPLGRVASDRRPASR